MRVPLLFLLIIPLQSFAQNVHSEILTEGILFTENNDTILFYQTAPKSLDGAYTRSNYIHPLYALDGAVLTEDFPSDHPHHRGIFWAWHQLYVDDQRIGDGWEIKDFSWEVTSVETPLDPQPSKSIQINTLWKSPLWVDETGNEKPLVSETTTVTVYPAEENYRAIDISISLVALESNMRIGGSEDAKGYGGFSPRVRLPMDVTFTRPQGSIKAQNLPVAATGWMDISGAMGTNGAHAGLTVFSHSQNPGYPNPWILRAKNSMQNAVYPHPGATPVGLSDTTPTVLKYRLLIHSGLITQKIKALYASYISE